MVFRKFKIGQIVHYKPSNHRHAGPRGDYQVIKPLPHCQNGEPKYRIRNVNESHERDVKESELKPRPNDNL
jgi:hypothetical protein